MKTEWLGKRAFISFTDSGRQVLMDAKREAGGLHAAASPMELVLSALTGCTGMDVVSILEKMKVLDDIEKFSMEVSSERSQDHPKVYTKIHLKYIFKFKGEAPVDKVEKAVNLSQEKYCSVAGMLKKAAEITYEIVYE
ncbi:MULTISPECIES: OsmC family protein [Pseudothermotoga]|jgi:putative redox protein|uniref:OsmC family protein n=1 Tax=Pseudothermotoga lettingae (strain ATCC BAA-301 / DSM 14385 / NBRC 107922 / TMO) TaxID=416591 RepID=A8F5U6_PSELT|nr:MULTISPECIES: OsmC family protein [Pseudothermotoga]ABV33530.1 OsmC family protein [Pseudothermotoga lettingae TMO]KUK20233.1 MAG: OsmC family protein [Pseudothermotoga lettingae]MDI3495285.1 putative redox protein [Pseudothermotoga sp.]MDK2883822.1 putative redox protein [Pseudothermotoga sp.]GLI49556.1 osmotically inducible protein C [Pseudothermotoga lettingae TMO]